LGGRRGRCGRRRVDTSTADAATAAAAVDEAAIHARGGDSRAGGTHGVCGGGGVGRVFGDSTGGFRVGIGARGGGGGTCDAERRGPLLEGSRERERERTEAAAR
jgi:hypothetical protein